MMRLQMTVAALALVMCCATVEARGGRRGGYAPYYYNNNYNYTYNVAPTTNVVPAAATTGATTATTSQTDVVQVTANKPDTTGATANAQSNATEATGNATAEGAEAKPGAEMSKPATDAPKPVVVGSAQWKAEQCARMGAVMHLGGHFGGGSHEGCGFGATADQAIRNACFWGQLTPIEIGVARGVNGYFSTIFYR